MTATHILASLTAAGPTTTTAKSSSGSSLSFLVLLVAVAAFYFLVIRPRAQRQRQARSAASTLEVGAPAMSVGGIKGTVVDLDGDDVRMEVAPGVVLTFTRRAVNAQPAGAGATAATDAQGAGGDGEGGPVDTGRGYDDIAFDDRSGGSGGRGAHDHDDEGQAGTGTEAH